MPAASLQPAGRFRRRREPCQRGCRRGSDPL